MVLLNTVGTEQKKFWHKPYFVLYFLLKLRTSALILCFYHVKMFFTKLPKMCCSAVLSELDCFTSPGRSTGRIRDKLAIASVSSDWQCFSML